MLTTVMDMSSGRIVEEEFGSFEDEVLNAGWMPKPEGMALQLGLQAVTADRPRPVFDADDFLRSIYASQE